MLTELLRRTRHRAGQAAVLIALTLFSLVIFLALATNMGILVNDRIRMQNAADLAAFGAAYREAQKLNNLVYLNQKILDKARECRTTLTSTIWTGEICTCRNISPEAELVIQQCEADLEALATDFRTAALYSNTVSEAKKVAESTLEANVQGLSGRMDFFDGNIASATSETAYKTDGLPTIANFERVENTIFNYPVLKQCNVAGSCISIGPVPSPNYELATWYHKDDTDPDVWVMVAVEGAMRSKYLDSDGAGGARGYFGGSSVGGADTMHAIAVAKPYDGSVGPANPPADFYRNGNLPDGPYYTASGLAYPEETMVEEYRARLAGIREWGNADKTPMGALNQSEHSSYADKLRH
jgi:Flp pilus assembly protein TadG